MVTQAKNLISFSFQASVNVNMQSYDGMTALHLAVMDELDNMCALLVNSGANPTILNYVNSSTSSENEECEENEWESVAEDCETGQSPLDLAQCNSMVKSKSNVE